MHKLSFSMRGLSYSLNALVLLALAIVMAGCGPGEGVPGTGPAACGADDIPLPGGGCQHVGLPLDMPCPPGETPINGGTRNGGSCQPAGVPLDGCGQGFEHDGKDGCNPILPSDPCPWGQMAVPGDIQCHGVAPCGTGDYGLIPVDADTEYVNGAYTGDYSNGDEKTPWRSIQEGIDYAKYGAIVAVAAGTYVEDVWIHNRPVRLWGRCPALVHVVGASTYATIEILSKPASHSEVHNLAITGLGTAILTSGVSDVVIDRVWIHDTGGRGISAQSSSVPASITITASLIETATHVGVFVGGSSASIDATVVRATRLDTNGLTGDGIVLVQDPATHERAKLTLRTSLLEGNHDVGMLAFGSDATIEASVIRNTQPVTDGTWGRGINIEPDPSTHDRARLTLRTSLLERNHDAGVAVTNSDAAIEATVVRTTQPSVDATDAGGIAGQNDDTHERGTLALSSSLLELNHDTGLLIVNSYATIESTVVRATQPSIDEFADGGIHVENDPITHERATMTLRTSVVEQNHNIGVAVLGSEAMIETTIVRAGQPRSDGTGGAGIYVGGDIGTAGALTVHASLLQDNHEIGVAAFNSDVTIDASVVRTTQSGAGKFGDGIMVQSCCSSTLATVTSTKVESNARAGIANFGAAVRVISSKIQCNPININGKNSANGTPFTFDGSKGNLCGCEFDGGQENLCMCANPDPTCPARTVDLSLPSLPP